MFRLFSRTGLHKFAGSAFFWKSIFLVLLDVFAVANPSKTVAAQAYRHIGPKKVWTRYTSAPVPKCPPTPTYGVTSPRDSALVKDFTQRTRRSQRLALIIRKHLACVAYNACVTFGWMETTLNLSLLASRHLDSSELVPKCGADTSAHLNSAEVSRCPTDSGPKCPVIAKFHYTGPTGPDPTRQSPRTLPGRVRSGPSSGI